MRRFCFQSVQVPVFKGLSAVPPYGKSQQKMALEPDTPDVRALVTIGLVGTFATIAISYLVVGMTHSERLSLSENRESSAVVEEAPAVSDESMQAVIQKYAK